MNIPKTIIIAGHIWKLVKEPKERGGWFSGDKQEVHLGTKNHTQQEQETILLHEIIEAIFAERLLRYKKPYIDDSNGNYLFVMNHQELENAVRDIYLALKGVY